jgi:hypothetical protein
MLGIVLVAGRSGCRYHSACTEWLRLATRALDELAVKRPEGNQLSNAIDRFKRCGCAMRSITDEAGSNADSTPPCRTGLRHTSNVPAEAKLNGLTESAALGSMVVQHSFGHARAWMLSKHCMSRAATAWDMP